MAAGWSTQTSTFPLCLEALVDLTQPVLVVEQGFVKDLPPLPTQGRGPVPGLTDARYR